MNSGNVFAQLERDGRRKVGLFGGTFDPIHQGHLILAEFAKEQLALDVIVFMPCAIPHFKQEACTVSAKDRLAMCTLATAGNPYFFVSDIEVARGGVTYTVDTIRQIKEVAPQLQITFIVGSDILQTLKKWRGAEELAQLTRFAYAHRPHQDGDDGQDLSKFVIDRFDCPEVDISSSAIRERVAHAESIRYLVPEAVRLFIKKHDLYLKSVDQIFDDAKLCSDTNTPCDPVAVDPLSKDFYNARKHEVKDRVTTKRFEHIKGVSKTAKHLAEIYNVDPRKAALAGLLHDWDKNYNDDEIRTRVSEVGLEDVIDPFVVESMPQVLHGPTAACALAQEFPEIPGDVIRAIYNHTTASKTADDLEKIIYISDAIEPTRTFDTVDEIRDAVGKESLDELFYRTYKFWTLALLERNRAVHPDTMSIWNELAARNRASRHDKKGK